MPNPHGAVPDARYSKKAATNTDSCGQTTVFSNFERFETSVQSSNDALPRLEGKDMRFTNIINSVCACV